MGKLQVEQSNKKFVFTIDDNVRFLREIVEENFLSIFSHPYLKMLRELHCSFGVKVQLNVFFEDSLGFDLSMMPDKYRDEWEEASNWLKLSFHSRKEFPSNPYAFCGYNEVFEDCFSAQKQLERFAGKKSLAKTTTLHYCLATEEGVKALKDNSFVGLLGLFGNDETPQTSYSCTDAECKHARDGEIVYRNGMAYAGIDIVLNAFSIENILEQLSSLNGREVIKIMIHEQYFYKDYFAYQPDFEEKLISTFSWLKTNGYESTLFEDIV